jgi:hypothetical protein
VNIDHQDTLWQLLGTLTVLLTVLASYLRTRTGQRQAHEERSEQHAETTDKLNEVAVTVNGATEVLHERIEQLTAALEQAGIELPPKPPTKEAP